MSKIRQPNPSVIGPAMDASGEMWASPDANTAPGGTGIPKGCITLSEYIKNYFLGIEPAYEIIGIVLDGWEFKDLHFDLDTRTICGKSPHAPDQQYDCQQQVTTDTNTALEAQARKILRKLGYRGGRFVEWEIAQTAVEEALSTPSAPETVVELLRGLGYTVTPPEGEQPVFPTVFAVSPPAPDRDTTPDRVAELEAENARLREGHNKIITDYEALEENENDFDHGYSLALSRAAQTSSDALKGGA